MILGVAIDWKEKEFIAWYGAEILSQSLVVGKEINLSIAWALVIGQLIFVVEKKFKKWLKAF